jgi:hypothetical protein
LVSASGTHVEIVQSDIRSNKGRIDNMADDRMKQDDQQRQAPGRGGPQGGQQPGQQGQQGGQKGSKGMEDDDESATGGQGQSGGQNRGGQNR